MDEPTALEHAQALCEAIVAGDVDRAIKDFSVELRRNLGEVLSLLPLPSSEATVESVAAGGSGFVIVLRLVGETEEVLVQTRWKERDGQPTIVEASHLSRIELATPAGEAAGDGEGTDDLA